MQSNKLVPYILIQPRAAKQHKDRQLNFKGSPSHEVLLLFTLLSHGQQFRQAACSEFKEFLVYLLAELAILSIIIVPIFKLCLILVGCIHQRVYPGSRTAGTWYNFLGVQVEMSVYEIRTWSGLVYLGTMHSGKRLSAGKVVLSLCCS